MNLFCRASTEERRAPRPGDAVIARPVCVLDHAVTIAAAPDSVWPWLAQMGADRGGWYSYDVLDNGGRPSARALIPDLQHLEVGMVLPALPGARDAFILTGFDRPRFLLLGVPGREGPKGAPGERGWAESFDRANWTFWLSGAPGGRTRLHVRARLGELDLDLPLVGRRRAPGWVARCLAPPVHFIMQRRQLNRIAARAAGDARA